MTSRLNFDVDVNALTIAPSPYIQARETSALAAFEAAPKAGTTCAVMLQLITEAGDAGISDPELSEVMRIPRSTVCARRNDIRVWLVPSDRRVLSPYGKPCVAWRRATPEEVARNRERERAQRIEG